MERCWLGLLIGVLLRPVLPAPPAPLNARINSTNFKHVLCWEPAPGTPPETLYMIYQRVRGQKKMEQPYNSSDTCTKVMLDNNMWRRYILAVRAFYNSTLSPLSNNVSFNPSAESKIGAPLLSLSGCGNCIKMNISMPQADKDSDIPDIQKFYRGFFEVRWRKKSDTRITEKLQTKNRSFTLNNLEKGVEYCVQVQMTVNSYRNTESSDWHCIFTSLKSPVIDPAVSGLFAGLTAAVILLATISFCLGYTGVVCKPKTARPAVLTTEHHEEHTLTLEKTILGQITLSSEMNDVRKRDSPTSRPAAAPQCSTELEGEKEDEGDDTSNNYMDRDQGLSSGHQVSPGVFGEEQLQASGDSGSSTVRSWTEPEDLQDEVDQDEATPESPGVSLTNETGPPGVQDQATDEKDSSFISSHVDLFSVTLASLAVEKKEEEEEEEDEEEEEEVEKKEEEEEEEEESCNFFREYSLKPVIFTELRQTSLSDSQIKTSSKSLMHRQCEDLTASEHENDEANTLIHNEEEEESCEYTLRHK